MTSCSVFAVIFSAQLVHTHARIGINWTKSANLEMPLESIHAASGYFEDSIYILGGGYDTNTSRQITQYDLNSNSVTLMNHTLNTSLYHEGHASTQIGHKVYGISERSANYPHELFVFNLKTLSFEDPIAFEYNASLLHGSCVTYSELGNTLYI